MNFVTETAPRGAGMGFAGRTFVSLSSSTPDDDDNFEPEPEQMTPDEPVTSDEAELAEAYRIRDDALASLTHPAHWCFATVTCDTPLHTHLSDNNSDNAHSVIEKDTTIMVFAPNDKETQYAKCRHVDKLSGAMSDGWILANQLSDFRFD